MTENLNFKVLIPTFDSSMFSFQTTEQLSSFFVGILILIALVFFIISVRSFWQAIQRIDWLTKLLDGKTSITVAQKRESLIEKAREIKKIANQDQGIIKIKKHLWSVGHLWLEFDETLTNVEKNGETHLYNIIDSRYFFNTSSLAKDITESRLLAAVPGFLTAFGVVGTFIGLQLGLSELNIGKDIAISEMKDGLSHVISGASVAFITSVWGVGLSVVFNFIEKLLERNVRARVTKIQDRIDFLFPRLSSEHQLQRIAKDGKESKESLQGISRANWRENAGVDCNRFRKGFRSSYREAS